MFEGLTGSILTVVILAMAMIVIFIFGQFFNFSERSAENRKKKVSKINSATFHKNPFKTFVGTEIECIRHGNCVSRSSLYNNNFSSGDDASLNGDGKEYRSSPSQGDKLFEMVDGFSKELIDTKHTVDRSCGLHIHIETPTDVDLIKKLYCFYSKYEGLFFAMLPKSRQKNKYCGRFNRFDKFSYKDVLKIKDLKEFKKLFYETNRFFPINDHGNKKRYCWVNFHSIFYRGTLEIRGHSGTINARKIKNWIMLHLIIRDLLERKSIDEIVKMKVSRKAFLNLFPSELKDYIQERWVVFPEIAEENFREYE
ncbi:MAG: amidoligase family protein [Methanogenium sp.]|jgi:hypothetical protein